MSKLITIGHKNPDTDSIVASLIAEDYCRNILRMDAKACRAGELNNESKFVLKRLVVEAPRLAKLLRGDEKVVLVDHNEKSQTVDGLNFSQVIGIIDHHKMSIETEKPISCRFEPVGSTSSVLAMMYQESGKKVSAKVAKLMLAGILSDTLNLTGPTTTDYDRKLVKELNKTAKLDIKKFVEDMFLAKSSLQGISVETIVNQDYKLFEMGKYKVGISVWETTDPSGVKEKKDDLIKFILGKKKREALDFMMFFVVDIMKQESLLYAISEDERKLAERAFKVKQQGDAVLLKDIVSRKKQIVPPLNNELTK